MDTNVLSELMRSTPDDNVLEYIETITDIAITAITVGEIQHGITRLPDGRRKSSLQAAFQAMLNEELSGRVLPYDQAAAVCYGELVTKREKIGQPISMADGQIAAICLSHQARLATRNIKDFNHIGLNLVNPWLI
ncbi:type II toxin-antitoxin system VapC family toxin [Duganella rivi]|nr:type II toxin-antitoxin system VapC family toxin [Duganella rivi]